MKDQTNIKYLIFFLSWKYIINRNKKKFRNKNQIFQNF